MSVFDDGSKSLRKGTTLPVLDYLQSTNFQSKCKFEFLITRNPFDDTDTKGQDLISNVVDFAVGAAGTAADVLITKFFLQSLRFPSEISLEYERRNSQQFVKGIQYPETVTMEFLDNESGLVRRYLTEWYRKILGPVPKHGPKGVTENETGFGVGTVVGFAAGAALGGAAKGLGGGLGGGVAGAALGGALGGGLGLTDPNGKAGAYVFKDNQKAAERTGMLLMFPRDNSIPLYPRIMFYGLKIKSISEYQISQEDGSPMKYTVEFAINDIKIPQII